PDDLARLIASRGGVIGLHMLAQFLNGTTSASLDDLLDHVDHFAALVGPDHVGLGPDCMEQWPAPLYPPALGGHRDGEPRVPLSAGVRLARQVPERDARPGGPRLRRPSHPRDHGRQHAAGVRGGAARGLTPDRPTARAGAEPDFAVLSARTS